MSSMITAPVAPGTTRLETLEMSLTERYRQVRCFSEALCAPLETEDYGVQSMADVSPPKWHLGHVSWFFETFLLVPHLPGYELFHPKFGYLFNSYYEAVGERHPRPQRGLLSRPTVAEVYRYRAYVDGAMERLLNQRGQEREIAALVVLGLHHEQQHQELLVTDIKHILAINPLRPVYREDLGREDLGREDLGREDLHDPVGASIPRPPALEFVNIEAGIVEMGRDVSGLEARFEDFAFDNEGPKHKVYVGEFAIANRLVTNREYLEFIEAGGYRQPQHWLSEGWGTILKEQWEAPLYWEKINDEWHVMTLGGLQPLNLDEPVCHVSLYEADAYASWAEKRLPTEAEWELVAQQQWSEQANELRDTGNWVEQDCLHPQAFQGNQSGTCIHQLFGDVWEWTQSAYLPYPGFQVAEGAIGEYNGKFMCGQRVLRGGSCATSVSHIRPTYRNFFPPSTRWQFSGIRLAR